MSSSTISWRDIALTWLTSQPQPDKNNKTASTLEELFDKYIPEVLEFLSPVLATCTSNSCSGVVQKSEPPAPGGSALSLGERVCRRSQVVESQELMLSEVHLTKTCCQILEVCVYKWKNSTIYFMYLCLCVCMYTPSSHALKKNCTCFFCNIFLPLSLRDYAKY